MVTMTMTTTKIGVGIVQESEEESYTIEADTSDTGSSAPDKGPARSRRTRREASVSTRRTRRQPSPTQKTQATIDMAAIRDMVRKGVVRELAKMDAGRNETRDRPVGIDEGPLSKRIYRESMADFKYLTTLPNFRGNGDTQDPHNFVHSFQEKSASWELLTRSCAEFSPRAYLEKHGIGTWGYPVVPSRSSNISQGCSWKDTPSLNHLRLCARCYLMSCKNPESGPEPSSTASFKNLIIVSDKDRRY